jgi:hypothetical protein
MSDSLCGQTIQSRRGLLALTWSLVTFLTILAFVVALGVTISAQNDDQYSSSNDDNNRNNEEEVNPEVAVTSRAMAFAALWTAVLACLMSVFGTVILGFQSPTGQYYTCCSGNVHRTSPLGLGSFIGALLMFSNLTLVCSVLFGEFEVSFSPQNAMRCNVNKSSHYQMFLMHFRFEIITERDKRTGRMQNMPKTWQSNDRPWHLVSYACF